MAEDNGSSNNHKHGALAAPPEQSVPGVVLYHSDPILDERIRYVMRLKEDYGYTIAEIAEALDKTVRTITNYLAQARQARRAYLETYPEDFEPGMESIAEAIRRRGALDELLRRELGKLTDDPNPSNRVGVYKLIMRNMRELEELAGLLITKIEHGGEVGIKDNMQALLDQAPAHLREKYLDALSALLASAGDLAQPQGNGGP